MASISKLTLAVRLVPRPLFVSLAPSDAVPDEHVAVVAFVGDERVVRDGSIDRAPVQRVAGNLTLDG